MSTPIKTKVNILSQLWIEYRNDEEFQDFCDYNDLGLPLAYAIDNGIVEITDSATKFIEESFALLLAGLGIEEDEDFENLDDLLDLDEY